MNDLVPKDKFEKSVTAFSRQVGALITLTLLLLILVCFTTIFCPANCGSNPVWCFSCLFSGLYDKIWGISEEHFENDHDTLEINSKEIKKQRN